MAREAKYTRTVAFRVTAEEWETISYEAQRLDRKPSEIIRALMSDRLADVMRLAKEDAANGNA